MIEIFCWFNFALNTSHNLGAGFTPEFMLYWYILVLSLQHAVRQVINGPFKSVSDYFRLYRRLLSLFILVFRKLLSGCTNIWIKSVTMLRHQLVPIVRLNILDCNFLLIRNQALVQVSSFSYIKLRFISFPIQLRSLQSDIWARSYIG